MKTPMLSRRDWLRLAGFSAVVGPTWGCLSGIAASAAEQQKRGGAHKNCILLYMNGGASHVDTFDPKPGNGEFKSIPTAVPGIQISEHLPKLAAQMKQIAVIRGMSTTEGSHARANYLAHTGYREGVGGVVHPTLGSLVSATIGPEDSDLPNFVKIGAGRKASFLGPGFLGARHGSLDVDDPEKGVENLRPGDSLEQFDARVRLLAQMDRDLMQHKAVPAAEAHLETYRAAVRLMHSSQAKAFDLAGESSQVRSAYGSHKFGQSCLLARRLVETGVPFVEIDYGEWDTHKDNFPRVARMSGELDQGLSALLADLQSRHLLQDTLIVWVGDFGRDPTVKNGGRGHWPKAWSTLLCGGGLKTGQTIGRTDRHGGMVEENPVGITDFFATICQALAIDHTKDLRTHTGRPMRVVMKGGNPIKQLFS